MHKHTHLTLAAVTAAALLALTGCGASEPETPEQTRYLDEVYEAAEDNGFNWSNELEAATLTVGDQTCRALDQGKTLEDIYAATRSEDPDVDAVVRLAVTYAPIYLCPGV